MKHFTKSCQLGQEPRVYTRLPMSPAKKNVQQNNDFSSIII